MANYDGIMSFWKDKVKNKIYEIVDAQAREDLQGKADASSLAAVATSGDYDDLLNKPTIPAAQVNADWNASSGVAEILNKPTLSDVATSGEAVDVSYDNTSSGWQTTNVQSTLDGLISTKMSSTNPIGTGSLSLNSGSLTGENAVSIGNGNQATGVASFSSGGGKDLGGGMIGNEPNLASGSSAHAMGGGCEASGDFSFAQGYGLEASSDYQHCIGKFNIPDPNNTYAEIVGNGTGFNSTSNGRTLDWNGNETIAGDLYFNGGVNPLSTQLSAKADASALPGGYVGDTTAAGQSVAHGTSWTTLLHVDITPGIYIVSWAASFASSGGSNTGYRGAGVATTGDPFAYMSAQVPAVTNNTYTLVSGSAVHKADANQTLNLKVRQYSTAGSNLTVTPRLQIIKIA